MYFLNDIHETNYNHMANMVFRNAKNDPEYNTVAYLLSLPDIYRRCIHDPMVYEFPFLWTVQYKDTSYTETDEDGTYKVIDFEIAKDEKGKELESASYGTLSSGYKKMIRLAANLFNSASDDFNLMGSFRTWDDDLTNVYYQATLLRLDRRNIGFTMRIK